jgi:Na+-driven multidrug efflux pump
MSTHQWTTTIALGHPIRELDEYLLGVVPVLSFIAFCFVLFSLFRAARARLRSSSLFLGCLSAFHVVLAYLLGVSDFPGFINVYERLWLVGLYASPILFLACAALPRRRDPGDRQSVP